MENIFLFVPIAVTWLESRTDGDMFQNKAKIITLCLWFLNSYAIQLYALTGGGQWRTFFNLYPSPSIGWRQELMVINMF